MKSLPIRRPFIGSPGSEQETTGQRRNGKQQQCVSGKADVFGSYSEAHGDGPIKGELHEKMNFTYMLGFGLVSGVVKVFPVSSLSLARRSTRKKRARRARMTKWDLKSRDRVLVGPDWARANAQQLAEHGPKHRNAARVVSWSATRLAIARSIACTGQLTSDRPRPVRSDEVTVTRLGIPFCHPGASCLFLPGRFSRKRKRNRGSSWLNKSEEA